MNILLSQKDDFFMYVCNSNDPKAATDRQAAVQDTAMACPSAAAPIKVNKPLLYVFN